MRWSSRGTPVDSTAPVVDNYDPVAGTPITPTQQISFDVTDESGLAATFVTAYFPTTGMWEVVFSTTGFAPRYAGRSSRSAIANGFRYTIGRVGGWPRNSNVVEGPTIYTHAIDGGGNESA